MARFNAQLPTELINALEKLSKDTNEMAKEMTHSAAEIVEENIKERIPKVFDNPKAKLMPLVQCLKVTNPYLTPSDDGINTKVAFYGYFINRYGKEVPAPLVAQVREYGSYGKNITRIQKSIGRKLSDKEYEDLIKDKKGGVAKRPFIRPSFDESQIVAAMEMVQEKYLPKD